MTKNIKTILWSLTALVSASSMAFPANTASISCAWPQKPQLPPVPGCKHNLTKAASGCTEAQCGARIKQEVAQAKTFYSAQLTTYQAILGVLKTVDSSICSTLQDQYLASSTDAYAAFEKRQKQDETAYENSCVITDDPQLPTK